MADLSALKAVVADQGPVTRVVIAQTRGSTPRDAGAAMLLTEQGQIGSIGGGRLEYEAAAWARAHLGVRRVALGPGIGQCCGGAVTLVAERISARVLATLDGPVWLRRVAGDAPCPPALARHAAVDVALEQGWLSERLTPAATPVVIHGAGHVGRALSRVLTPLPGFDVTLADPREDALPDPRDALTRAPDQAAHIIVTHDHALDLDLCHRALSRPCGFVGLIGSATKWARFRKRLTTLGHDPAQIDRIHCPIGTPALGKHPQAIAIGVAQALLIENCSLRSEKEAAE